MRYLVSLDQKQYLAHYLLNNYLNNCSLTQCLTDVTVFSVENFKYPVVSCRCLGSQAGIHRLMLRFLLSCSSCCVGIYIALYHNCLRDFSILLAGLQTTRGEDHVYLVHS